jgi:hypothetical protein
VKVVNHQNAIKWKKCLIESVNHPRPNHHQWRSAMNNSVTIRIGIPYPNLVWERAVESYLKDGNEPGYITERFGTREAPRLTQCVTEICAEADHAGLFEFMD